MSEVICTSFFRWLKTGLTYSFLSSMCWSRSCTLIITMPPSFATAGLVRPCSHEGDNKEQTGFTHNQGDIRCNRLDLYLPTILR